MAYDKNLADTQHALDVANAHIRELQKPRDRERIEFIRRAAIAVWQESERGDDFAECWNVAKVMWDMKPEGL